MASVTIPHLSGLFTGTMTSDSPSPSPSPTHVPLNFVLSLRGGGGPITAFGCGYTVTETGCDYTTLRGTAALESGSVHLEALPTTATQAAPLVFDGIITSGGTIFSASCSPTISGTWRTQESEAITAEVLNNITPSSGTFTVTQVEREPEFALLPASAPRPPPRHCSGLWLGEAIPLEAFAHDTARNPITWALSHRTKEELEHPNAPAVFGCGFFDDSGDIPDMPILFYTLQHENLEGDGSRAGGGGGGGAGEVDGAAEAARVTGVDGVAGAAGAAGAAEPISFMKVYQEPLPHRVLYSEVNLGTGEDGVPTLSGSWANILEGTAGVFAARMEPPTEGFVLAKPGTMLATPHAAATEMPTIGE